MDWRPEHHSEGRYRLPRLAEWFEVAMVTVIGTGVLAVAILTAAIVAIFPLGLPL